MVTANTDADLAKYKVLKTPRQGWVIAASAPEVPAEWTAPATRFTNEELAALEKATTPGRGRVLAVSA